MLAVPAAALMLGASQTAAKAGVGISFWGAYGGYGYGHGPITAMAFGLPAGDWTTTPAGDWDTAGTGSMTAAGLNVDWSSPNTWVSVLYGDPDSTAGPWNSPLPGNPEVLWGYLDDGNATSQAPAVTVTGLAAKFPSGYVVQTIAAQDANPVTIANVSVNDGGTPQTLTYSTSWHLYDWYGPVAGADHGTAFLSTPSGTFTGNTLNIQCDLKGSTGDRSVLCGFVITDKPVVTSCLPAATTILPGSSFTLSSTAIGLGTLSYQWKHNGTDISGATGPTYTVATASPTDTGTYSVVVTSNLYPSDPATSETVNVTVSVPATVTWDADTGTTGAQDGSGTWDLSGTNWWTGSANQVWNNLDYAVFGDGGAGSSTITLASDVTTSGLSFTSGTHTITTSSSKTINLFGNAAIATTGNATLSVPVVGTSALNKTGAGTLKLSTASSYTGGTVVNAGTLDLAYTSGVGGTIRDNLTINPGATVVVSQNNAFGYGGDNWVRHITITGGTLRTDTASDNGWGTTINLTRGSMTSGVANGYFSMGNASVFNVTGDTARSVISANLTVRDNIVFNVSRGSDTLDLDISGTLINASGGGITKNGNGIMRLGAVNTFSGGTTINGGKLVLAGRVSGGPFTMNDNTTLSVSAAGGTPAISTTGTMTVGSDPVTPAGTNTIEFAGLSSASVAPITAGYVFLDNPVTINITSIAPVTGQYPLIKFSNSGGGSVVGLTLGTLPSGVTATLVDDTAGPSQSIYLDVTEVTAPISTWTGAASGIWDVNTSLNWTEGGPATKFQNGNIVYFDDSAGQTSVTLDTTVSPSEVNFVNSAGIDYTVSGTGSIDGFTQLYKTGTGRVTLSNNNTYTGITTVSAGTLEVRGTLATSGISNSATVEYNSSSPQTVTYGISGGGSIIKSGNATLTLQGNKNFGGGVAVNQGTLHINAGGWYTNPFGQTNTVTVNTGGTLSTAYAHSLGVDQNTLHINGGTLALGAENYISNLQMTGGTVTGGELRTWGGTMTFNQSSTGAVIASPFNLVGGATLSVADGTAADDLTISGVIFNGNGITKTGAGTLRLTAVNTYTGTTTVNEGTLAVNGTSIPDTNKLVIGAGKVEVTGTETVNTLFFGAAQQAAGTWGATGSGAAHIDNAHFSGTGVLTVLTSPDYSSWAAANAPGQTASQDHDNDGVTNGVEYFMGLTGSAFTANPGVVSGKVSWPKGASYIGAYGTDYVVQKSSDLSTWTDVLISDPNLNNGSPLEYTLPTGNPKIFTRLKVTGP